LDSVDASLLLALKLREGGNVVCTYGINRVKVEGVYGTV
jgi:hypothetical protein